MTLELLPAVNVGGIPMHHYEDVRHAAMREGLGDTRAPIVKWAVVELSKRLRAEKEAEKEKADAR